ncbi:MAG TPA: cysteine-rich CWC family protein [Bacillota bacterium]|nr:cysteine-rich CWC family protein [Bacillota bacterium]
MSSRIKPNLHRACKVSPVGGGANDCLLAAGAHSNERCWCFFKKFPAALLAQVPKPARHRACICQRCWAALSTR